MAINVFGGGNTSGPVFPVQRSVRLRSSASAYFNRTPASNSNFQINTLSFWVKRGSLGSRQALFSWSGVSTANNHSIEFTAGDIIAIYSVGTAAAMDVESTQVFRDPSAWYHIVYSIDTTQATAANRIKLYVNGTQVSSFSVSTYPSQNANLQINSNNPINIGRRVDNTGAGFFDGYLTEVNFIDGQALTPSSFGSTNATTGVWQPIKYTGTYGTNGFYLNFQDNSAATAAAIGKDSSGNGNNWTPNNISVTAGVTYDSMLDVPTLTSATNSNFCTLNPLKSAAAPTAGNLQVSSPQVYGSRASMAVSSGKWYWEVTATTTTSFSLIGVLPATIPLTVDAGSTSSSCSAYYVSGSKSLNGTFTSYGSSWTSGDVIGVALDCDANTIQFYKNNTAQGALTLYTSAGTEVQPFVCDENNAGSVFAINFGQRPFTYTPPTGFKALNTFNLPDSAIPKGKKFFDATNWTGTGASLAVNVTGEFQPDLVWIKGRSGATGHRLTDSVRGATLALSSDSPSSNTITDTQGLTSFNSGGFTVGSNTTYNASAATFIAWQWKKSASAGIDITPVFTGTGAVQTVNHSLGVTPSMIILFSTGGNWINTRVYHKNLTAGNVLALSTTAAQFSDPTVFASVGSSSFQTTQTSGQTNVAYCFAEVAGFSKFGSYTGNGSADGPFIYCGFRPRFILVKNSTNATGYDWYIYDTSRDTYNIVNHELRPNLSNAEGTNLSNGCDFLSNGFKIKDTSIAWNGSSNTIIYAAFAENPFKNALAR